MIFELIHAIALYLTLFFVGFLIGVALGVFAKYTIRAVLFALGFVAAVLFAAWWFSLIEFYLPSLPAAHNTGAILEKVEKVNVEKIVFAVGVVVGLPLGLKRG